MNNREKTKSTGFAISEYPDVREIMKQLNAQEIDADEVVIKTKNGNLVIRDPQVVRMSVSGVPTFQIIGEAREEEAGVNPDDVKLVMQNTGCSEKQAIDALAKSKGDIAEAIMKLKD